MPGIDGTGMFFEPLIHVLPQDIPVSVVAYPQNAILSLEEHARFVAQHFPTDSVIAVAESFSGLVALELLHLRPREVKGIVFSAAFAEPLHGTLIHCLSLIPGIEKIVTQLPPSLLGRFLFGPFSNKELETLLARNLPRIDTKCLKNRAGIITKGYPLLDERFDIPCLYLQATRDKVVPPGAASWFADHFKSFECTRIDTTHCLLQTKPAECSARILAFIQGQIYPA